jgi:hypothetical protein
MKLCPSNFQKHSDGKATTILSTVSAATLPIAIGAFFARTIGDIEKMDSLILSRLRTNLKLNKILNHEICIVIRVL